MTTHTIAAAGSVFDRIPVLRAFLQTPRQVVVRFPGNRILSRPLPIASFAGEHWEYAWLSVAAYNKTPAADREARRKLSGQQEELRSVLAHGADSTGEASASAATVTDVVQRKVSAEAALEGAGWRRWADFPDDGLLHKIRSTHLRVEVWERSSPNAIAVTFGGTVFNNEKDWIANLRWVSPGHRDEYTDVVQRFAPEFAKRLRQRFDERGTEGSGDTVLISTGHSLGGGLAQQFAYSVPVDSPVRVERVYAFDPSPVTGFFSVQRRLRNHNRRGLRIDRIYERGEVLALLRSLMSLVYKPTARNAAIRGVRYSVFPAWNPIAAHSIVDLAAKLDGEVKGSPAGMHVPGGSASAM